MTPLRLIDLIPMLAELPMPVHEALGRLLSVSPEAVFAIDGDALAGLEDDAAILIATECLTLARSRSRSPLLAKPVRTLVPLAEHVAAGTGDLRAELPTLTLRELRGLEGVDETLARIIGDVLAFAPGSAPLRSLSLKERVQAASAAGAVASQSRSPIHDLEPPISLLSAWGRWEADIERFSQVGDAVQREGCPPEVESAWQTLGAMPLAVLGADRRDEFDPTSSLTGLIAGLDERQRSILGRRTCSLVRGPTLEELAREMDITRERVRQLESRALEGLEDQLRRPHCAAVARAASRLHLTLGAAASLDLLNGSRVSAALDSDAAESERLAALVLLHIAGPYELWGEWLVRRPAKDVVFASLDELDRLFEMEFPLVDEALEALQRAGIREHALRDWLGLLPRVRLLGEYVVPWSGTLADKAETVLRVAGRPLTFDEIVEAIADEFNVRTLRNYLSSDPRFRRVGLRVFGLEEWGGEEYTTIADEIAQEIERRGGEAALDDLVTTLTEKFGVAANSVLAYATGPQFERTPDAMFRVRTARAKVPTQPIEFTRRCFRIRGQWSFRITVTYDTIRGSGAAIPQGFAGYLRLSHGDEVHLEARELQLRFTWPSLLPSVGSLRAAVDAFGAKEGDHFFLVADPAEGAASIVHVPKSVLDGCARPEDRLLLEVAGTATSEEPLVVAVAEALGLSTSEASWASVRRRLRTRSEEDLLALVPTSDSGDESGLDDLMALVNL